jgi:hypothetical protein
MNLFELNKNRIAKNIQESYIDIEKGREASIGEIREWANGKKKQKQADGSWKTISRSGKAVKQTETTSQQAPKESSDLKTPGTLTSQEAYKKHNFTKFTSYSTPEGAKVFTNAIKDMKMMGRIKALNDFDSSITNDEAKVKGYQKYSDHRKAKAFVSSLRQKFVSDTSIKAGNGKTIKIDNKGDFTINGVRVQVRHEQGSVKLGEGPVAGGGGRGAMYGGGSFDNQLQGIVYTNTMGILKRLVLDGKSWKEIESYMADPKNQRTSVSGDKQLDVWKEVKQHLKL